ncbi:TRAP transporter small permease [Blastococcus sp. BMG 814]|uniref:TRAP transporter small permease n=1 Tax=Blastococcus carthaginiensis TaxID=3050034 RepID=A0ABT9IBJ1_9ACTN|nr:TRAP transporter small permease [Blastococcus carthaginiensis]MDP5182544.1 TRAP transporter small permease [Blastococcus carthaginiensis]
MSVLDPFVRGSRVLNRGLAALAGVALMCLMLVLIAAIVLRAFGSSLEGSVELVSMLAVPVFGLALGAAQTEGAHVSIDLIFKSWRKGVRRAVGAVIALASAALFVQIAVSLVVYTLNMRSSGSMTDALGLPLWPTVLTVVVGVFGLIVALVADAAKAWLSRTSDDPSISIF